MDPLSLAASLTALISVATNLVKTGYALVQSMRELRKELESVTDEVALLAGVMQALLPSATDKALLSLESELLSGSSDIQSSKSTPSDSDSEFEATRIGSTRNQIYRQMIHEIRSCRKTLAELEKFVDRVIPKQGEHLANAAKQIQWSLKKSDLQRLRESLERHKTAFVLLLSAQGTQVP